MVVSCHDGGRSAACYGDVSRQAASEGAYGLVDDCDTTQDMNKTRHVLPSLLLIVAGCMGERGDDTDTESTPMCVDPPFQMLGLVTWGFCGCFDEGTTDSADGMQWEAWCESDGRHVCVHTMYLTDRGNLDAHGSSCAPTCSTDEECPQTAGFQTTCEVATFCQINCPDDVCPSGLSCVMSACVAAPGG